MAKTNSLNEAIRKQNKKKKTEPKKTETSSIPRKQRQLYKAMENKDPADITESIISSGCSWGELLEHDVDQRTSISLLAKGCIETIDNIEKLQAFMNPEDQKCVDRLNQVFSKDVENYLDGLDETREYLQSKKDPILTSEDFMDFTQVATRMYNNYQAFVSKLTPVAAEIASIMMSAEGLKQDEEDKVGETSSEEGTLSSVD